MKQTAIIIAMGIALQGCAGLPAYDRSVEDGVEWVNRYCDTFGEMTRATLRNDANRLLAQRGRSIAVNCGDQ